MAGITLATAIFWSLVRTLFVCTLALVPLAGFRRVLSDERSANRRRFWLAVAIAPFFVPELLTGFQYRLTAASLAAAGDSAAHLVLTELLYGTLLLLRAVAVGVLLQGLLPASGVTSASLHTWQLLRGTVTRWDWWRGWLRLNLGGRWRAGVTCWSLMAIVTFQEFETAALMQIDRHPMTWTVWLFDAQAAMQPLSESLRMSLVPLGLELLLLMPCAALLWRSPSTFRGEHELQASPQKSGWLAGWFCGIYAVIAAGLLVITPVWQSLLPAIDGLIWIFSDARLALQSIQQVLVSAGFSVTATVVSLGVCWQLQSGASGRGGTRQRLVTIVLLMPGLLGPLALSLSLLSLFQWGVFRWMYDTWLPMLLGQVLMLLPRAYAMSLFLGTVTDQESLYLARLAGSSGVAGVRRSGRALVWRLRDVRWLLAGLLLTQWCFWDVTVASSLRPVSLEPAVTRLYNEMHFARTEALLGLSFLAALTPLLVWVFALAVTYLIAARRQ